MSEFQSNHGRMIGWTLLGTLAFAVAILSSEEPMVALAAKFPVYMWGLSLICSGAYAGYWIHRAAFGVRLTPKSPAHHHISRAVIIAAAIVALGLRF